MCENKVLLSIVYALFLHDRPSADAVDLLVTLLHSFFNRKIVTGKLNFRAGGDIRFIPYAESDLESPDKKQLCLGLFH